MQEVEAALFMPQWRIGSPCIVAGRFCGVRLSFSILPKLQVKDLQQQHHIMLYQTDSAVVVNSPCAASIDARKHGDDSRIGMIYGTGIQRGSGLATLQQYEIFAAPAVRPVNHRVYPLAVADLAARRLMMR